MTDLGKQTDSRDGLIWDDSGWDTEPRWAREPQLDSIEAVCRRALSVKPTDPCAISFHAAGAFNKLYLITTSSTKTLLRVSLPVDPKNKTRGEVATLRWIRRATSVPVPKVIAFDDSQDNEIGFEWILMELMKGESAWKRWRTMSMPEKTWFLEQVTDFQTQVFRQSFETARFRAIGTLLAPSPPEADNSSQPAPLPRLADTKVKPSRLVTRLFFWGNHFNYDIPRGPYRFSHDWLAAILALVRHEQTEIIQKVDALESPDEDDQDEQADAKQCLKVVNKLTCLLPSIFQRLQAPAERTVLWHDDLSLMNILVDDDAKITAVIDWECVSTKPLWLAATTPKFLRGPNRERQPERDGYADETASEKEAALLNNDEDGLDNQGKNELYWIHMMEYELTQLRKLYASRMKQLWPQWEVETEDGSLKADFYEAVHRTASGWHHEAIEKWSDAVSEHLDTSVEAPLPRLMNFLDPTGLFNST